MTLLHFTEFYDFQAAWKHSKNVMWDVICANWKLWPMVQLVNLGLLPPMYRVVVVNFVCVFWNLYLSWKNQKAKEETEAFAAASADKVIEKAL